MKAYVERFQGQAITTDDWLAHFWQYWNKQGTEAQLLALNKVEWDRWMYGVGGVGEGVKVSSVFGKWRCRRRERC